MINGNLKVAQKNDFYYLHLGHQKSYQKIFLKLLKRGFLIKTLAKNMKNRMNIADK
jgi:thiamine monophosphate synthase